MLIVQGLLAPVETSIAYAFVVVLPASSGICALVSLNARHRLVAIDATPDVKLRRRPVVRSP